MPLLSNLAESMIGSEIVKLGNEISTRIRDGEKIYNFTIGDFAPAIFPIPELLEDLIVQAYRDGFTHYPPAEGVMDLRQAVAEFIFDYQSVLYKPSEIQISSGGRPLIYSLFRTVVNPGDKVIYPIPSWNNNHYTFLNGGTPCEVMALPENNFMPTAEDIAVHIEDAALLCLCTPQNPTGTALSTSELKKICQLVVDENKRRDPNAKKLYVLFDQMYWALTYGDTQHAHPASLIAEMKDYTICIDGVSKAFAGTGVRVGWALGPEKVIAKMKAFLSHIGAWAPMAEQRAVAQFLKDKEAVSEYLSHFKKELENRLWAVYKGFNQLQEKGHPIAAIEPQAAIYLTIKIDLKGKRFGDKVLSKQSDVTQYLISEAGLAIVPFICFGADSESPWYRISVGTCRMDDLKDMFEKLTIALSHLQ